MTSKINPGEFTGCKNCNAEINGKYCESCGQPTHLKRIDSHYVSHEIQHLLHVEKGFLYTLKVMLLRPGQAIREYINDNRTKPMKPIPFLIFTSLLYTLVNNYFHIEERFVSFNDAGLSKPGEGKSSVAKMIEWVQSHYGYANILMGVFIALLLKMFFRKYKYNIFEITVLLCFVMGQGMFLLAVFSILAGITQIKLIFTISGVVVLIYSSWAIGQFYNAKKFSSFVKSFFAYILGSTLFYILLVLAGVLFDKLTR